MKKSTTRRLLLLCLCLTLITVSLIGGTLAKYTSTVGGSGTIQAASWDFDVTINSTAVESTSTTFTMPTGKMYPGMTDISIPVYVKNGSDTVTADYTVTVTVSNEITNLTAKFGESDLTLGTAHTTTAATLAVDGVATTNLVLSWPYGENVDDTADAGDTVTVTITVTGNQNTGKSTT